MVRSHKSAAGKATNLLDRLGHEVRRTLRAADAAHVHDLRVAMRRFRQALAAMEDHAAVPGIRDIHRTLKKTRALAGDVRDCDVTAKLSGKLSPSPAFLARLALRRDRAQRRLLSALRQWIDRKTEAAWREKLAGFDRHPFTGRVLSKAVKHLFNRGEKVGESIRALHRLRIAAKKLRYTMEFAGHADRARLARVQTLQSQLGEISDCETALRIAAEESAGKRIADRLQRHQRKEIRAFLRLWNRDFAGKRSEWIKSLTQGHK